MKYAKAPRCVERYESATRCYCPYNVMQLFLYAQHNYFIKYQSNNKVFPVGACVRGNVRYLRCYCRGSKGFASHNRSSTNIRDCSPRRGTQKTSPNKLQKASKTTRHYCVVFAFIETSSGFCGVGGAGADGVKRVEIIYFLIAKKLAVVCFLRARRIEKSFCFYRTSKITRAQKISPRVIIQ